jgi:hypothetical protein
VSSPLAQDLATKIIEVLTSREHVLLSKGGRPALVRELSEGMNDKLANIIGRMPPPGIVENEVTSTFGDESVDDSVEEMVEDVTASLMDSEQVEDVFSEDAVIRRDVFRVVKDTLLSTDRPWGESEEADVEVALDSLGYVAGKAAQRAGAPMVEAALNRAGKATHAKLLRYSAESQTATFRAALGTPDARLELEEAVADELSNLVDEGKVALPTVERRIALGRSASPEERTAARTRIDIAATKTLLRSGCTATWEFAGDNAIAVSLVPMSDQDGRGLDPFVEAFAREVQSIFSRPRPAAEPVAGGLDAWLRLARGAANGGAAKPAEKRAAEGGKEPVSKRAAAGEPASKRPVDRAVPVKASAAEKAPSAKAEPPVSKRGREAEKAASPASKRKAPVAKKASAKKTAAAKESKPAAKKPAAKKAAPKAKPASAARAKLAKPKLAAKAAPARARSASKPRPAAKTKATPRARPTAKAKPVARAKALSRAKPVAKAKALSRAKPVAKAKALSRSRPAAKAKAAARAGAKKSRRR